MLIRPENECQRRSVSVGPREIAVRPGASAGWTALQAPRHPGYPVEPPPDTTGDPPKEQGRPSEFAPVLAPTPCRPRLRVHRVVGPTGAATPMTRAILPNMRPSLRL